MRVSCTSSCTTDRQDSKENQEGRGTEKNGQNERAGPAGMRGGQYDSNTSWRTLTREESEAT